jgi:phage-related protein
MERLYMFRTYNVSVLVRYGGALKMTNLKELITQNVLNQRGENNGTKAKYRKNSSCA